MPERDFEAIGTCGKCQRPIRWGSAYMPAIPFVGSWGGFWHQYCPPTLIRTAPKETLP